MSNPLSNVPPPAALPSFVAAPLPPPASGSVPPPAGAAQVVTSVPPAPAASAAPPPPPPVGVALPRAARPPPPPMGVAAPGMSMAPPMPVPQPGPPMPPPVNIPQPMVSVNQAAPPIPSLQPAVSAPPPMGAPAVTAPPAGGAAGPPPPPPVGTGHVPLSAAGHLSRPRYVAPPELPTTGGAGPAPLYQTGVITGAPVMGGAPPGASVMSMPAVGGATVDYAQTPYAAPASYQAGYAGGQGGSAEQGDGWLGWLKDTVQKSEVLSKVAERARTSMDSMITTLDPQMRDLIYSGGDLDIVVASDKELKVSAVREAFQAVFGKATVLGVPAPGPGLVPQPVGWQGGRAAAEARVQSLRSSGLVPAQQAIVSAEGFIVQLQPERWFDMTLLLLDDPGASPLSVYTQPTELPEAWVQRMEASTATDHPQRWAGLQLTTGQVAAETLQVSPSGWHEVVCGLTRREMLLQAARTLAHQYRTRRGS